MNQQSDRTTSIPPVWRNTHFLRVFAQIAFLFIVIALFVWLFSNTQQGLKRANLSLGFDFLNQASSFQIDEGLVPNPHTRQDSFAHAFTIGLINTLRVVVVGL